MAEGILRCAKLTERLAEDFREGFWKIVCSIFQSCGQLDEGGPFFEKTRGLKKV